MGLWQESGSTPEGRLAEMEKIADLLSGHELAMEKRELEFLNNCQDGRPITPNMLFWLRDIKDKYL